LRSIVGLLFQKHHLLVGDGPRLATNGMGVSLEEVHDLLGGDLLFKGFLQTLASEHPHQHIWESVVLPHEQPQDGAVQQAVCVGVHFEV